MRSRAPLYSGKLKHRGRITKVNGGYIYVLVNFGYEMEFYDVELERYR